MTLTCESLYRLIIKITLGCNTMIVDELRDMKIFCGNEKEKQHTTSTVTISKLTGDEYNYEFYTISEKDYFRMLDLAE